MQYEVVYFDIRGRAEPIRLLLALAGQPFTDTRLDRDGWGRRKGETPLGQVPVLIERDGDQERQIPQSQAILRHLARVHGLYGQTEAEQTAADVLAETAADLRVQVTPLLFGPQSKDPAAKERFATEGLPVHLDRLARLLRRGPAAGFFVAATPTWADVVAFDGLRTLLELWPGCLDPHPELLGFYERMGRVPALASALG